MTAPIAPLVVFAANAQCDPATGQTTVSWQVTNNSPAPVEITGITEPVTLEPNPIPPFNESSATRVVEGPEIDQAVTSTVTIDAGGGNVFELSDDITAAACQGPATPPDVTFTFIETPSVTTAAVGDTIEYSYCGENTSTIPLQVVRLVDDRIGVVIEDPSRMPVAQPGETVCNTQEVNYVVQAADAGSVIRNNAVVTVQTVEDEPREFQQTATAEVEVPVQPIAPESTEPVQSSQPETTMSPAVLAAAEFCPGTPTQIYDESNPPAGNVELPTASEVVLFVSGTFTVGVNANSGGTVCVGPDATINFGSLNGPVALHVAGTVEMSQLDLRNGATLNNSGTVSLGGLNVTGDVTNSGTIEVQGTLNFDGGNMVNNGNVTTGGDLDVAGAFVNTTDSHVAVGGRLTVDGGGVLTNHCSLTAASVINDAAVINHGVIDAGQSLVNNAGRMYNQSGTGVTSGGDFGNEGGSVTGTGQYRFENNTRNQGSFTGSSASEPIVFFDASPTGDQVFDTEGGTISDTIRAEVDLPSPGVCSVTPPTPTTTSPATTTSTTTTTTTLPPTTPDQRSSSPARVVCRCSHRLTVRLRPTPSRRHRRRHRRRPTQTTAHQQPTSAPTEQYAPADIASQIRSQHREPTTTAPQSTHPSVGSRSS